MHVDGGARGNPGPAATAAVAATADGEVIERHGELIGEATNNVAEYRAMLLGIERARALGACEVELIGDSELIVRQLRGEYKVKDRNLRRVARSARAPRSPGSSAGRCETFPASRTPRPTGSSIRRSTRDDQAMSDERGDRPIDPEVEIGHVHLKVADLDRALDFYSGVLGFELQEPLRWPMRRSSPPATTTTTSASTPGSRRAARRRHPGSTGLFHTAIRYPTRRALADSVRRALDAGIALDGASDHGVSEAIYLRDPDQNGVELYWDRPREQWPRPADGSSGVAMFTAPLDLPGLLSELERG